MRGELEDGDEYRQVCMNVMDHHMIIVYIGMSYILTRYSIICSGQAKCRLIQCDSAAFYPTSPIVATGMAWKADTLQESILVTPWAP